MGGQSLMILWQSDSKWTALFSWSKGEIDEFDPGLTHLKPIYKMLPGLLVSGIYCNLNVSVKHFGQRLWFLEMWSINTFDRTVATVFIDIQFLRPICVMWSIVEYILCCSSSLPRIWIATANMCNTFYISGCQCTKMFSVWMLNKSISWESKCNLLNTGN